MEDNFFQLMTEPCDANKLQKVQPTYSFDMYLCDTLVSLKATYNEIGNCMLFPIPPFVFQHVHCFQVEISISLPNVKPAN